MSQQNKLRTGMLIGAVVGGLITMLDKNTRDATIKNCQSCFNKVKTIVKEPQIVTNKVKEVTDKTKQTITNLTEDVNFITAKINELKEASPEVVGLIKEAEAAFVNKEQQVEGNDNLN